MVTKSEFNKRKKIKSLSPAEKEKRWAQHMATQQPKSRRPKSMPLSEGEACALRYAQAITNPFECDTACVPSLPTLPSLKTKSFARGTMACGSAGFGFCSLAPISDSTNNCAQYTSAAYAGTTVVTSGAGVGNLIFNSPFTSAEVGTAADDVQVRTVGIGIRVRYSGTNLNLGGTIYALEHPDHRSIVNYSVSDFLRFDRVKTFPVSRSWTYVAYQPISYAEMAYGSSSTTLGTSGITNHFLAIAIQSTASNPFDVEVVMLNEWVGSIARGKTDTPSSPLFNSILSWASNLDSKQLNAVARGAFNVSGSLLSIWRAMSNGTYQRALTF